MHPILSDITLAFLAGGEGSRMGKPKGELEVGGQPILAYLLERFRWPGPTLLVTAPGREHPPGCELFMREVSDPVAGLGPLRGLLTALEASETSMLIATTVDMPEIGIEQFAFLAAGMKARESAVGLMLHSPEDRLRVEPFPSIFRKAAVEVLRVRLGLEKRSVHSLANQPHVVSLPWPRDWPSGVWTNLNRPEELIAWLAR